MYRILFFFCSCFLFIATINAQNKYVLRELKGDKLEFQNDYPELENFSVTNEQLQKSRYTKYHPNRNLNNYYFELKEFTNDEVGLILKENVNNFRLFYFGAYSFGDLKLVIILINDTVFSGVNDSYVTLSIDSCGKVTDVIEIGKLLSEVPEKNFEITSILKGNKIYIKQLYEEYNTPIDEEPTRRIEESRIYEIGKNGTFSQVIQNH